MVNLIFLIIKKGVVQKNIIGVDFVEREKILGELINKDGSINSDNWITPKDIVEFVKKELSNVDENDFRFFNIDKIKQQISSFGALILEAEDVKGKVYIKSFQEYLKYIEIKKPDILFFSLSAEKYSEDYKTDFLFYSDKDELDDCDILKEITDMITDFIDKHNIEYKEMTIKIFDNDGIGIIKSTRVSCLSNLSDNLHIICKKLEKQSEVYETMTYIKALDEVKGLYSYLIINGDFLDCKTDKQFKIYKDKESYLKDERFENLEIMIRNKPRPSSYEYAKYKELYVAFEDAFEKAKRFVKYGEQ